jgi:hypothetical protein
MKKLNINKIIVIMKILNIKHTQKKKKKKIKIKIKVKFMK